MAKWEREESGQRNTEKSYEFFPDGSHGGKGAILTSPHGVEGRPPAASTVFPGPSVSQVALPNTPVCHQGVPQCVSELRTLRRS